MIDERSMASQILAYAEAFPHVRAGIAGMDDLLEAPSYRAVPEEERIACLSSFHREGWIERPTDALSVLVLGLHHPSEEPRLDWWIQGNSPGNAG